MKNSTIRRFSLLSALLISYVFIPTMTNAASSSDDSMPAAADTQTPAPPNSAKAPTTVTVKKPTAPTSTTVPTVAPAAATHIPQAASPVETQKSAEAPTGSITVADLTVSNARVVLKKDHLDVFCSIKNVNKVDERLGGAGTPLSNGEVVMVTKDKDGKEQESPVGIVLTGEKTVELSPNTTWIRIKDVKTEPKSSDTVPITFYFRRSPNAVLRATVSSSEGGSLMDWFKK